jgi:phosphonate metabolism-associated iron-containing alcohol dehydrogenase
MPTKIVFGNYTFNNINNYINGRKTLLITSIGFVERGLVDKTKSLTGSIIAVISEVKSHPEFQDLKIMYNKIKEMDFEVILAIGGGSVLDAAKFLSVYNSKKEYQFVEDITKGNIYKNNYNLTPIVSVPTTSGTGSEITPWASIWDLDEKKKYSLHLSDLFSEVAIYDPTLTLSVPKEITIQTGLDTLSHALESIWNKNASNITLGFAIKAAKLILEYLVLVSNNLDNLKYRYNIMKSSMYAGLAFSNTQTAIAHAISYYITVNKGVDHGIACSFTLPMLIDNIIGKYGFIDDALFKIFGELSSQKLRNIFQELNIPIEFEDYSVCKNEFEEIKLSLQYNERAANSIISPELLKWVIK